MVNPNVLNFKIITFFFRIFVYDFTVTCMELPFRLLRAMQRSNSAPVNAYDIRRENMKRKYWNVLLS